MLRLRRKAVSSEEKDSEKFISPEEKQARIDEAWDKVRKNEWISKWIRSVSILAGVLAAFVIEIAYFDVLPRELMDQPRYSRRGGVLFLK